MPSKKTHLVIVESPAKATTIARFLGDDYRVEASYGHVRDLPQNAKEIPAAVRKKPWARLGVNVDEGFEPVYVVPAEKKKHVQRLKDALKNADSLLLATDEDREGESISWHVLELLKPKKGSVDVQRIVFHEVTPEAIRGALDSPRAVDENLVRAQEARRVLDRLYGYSLSPLLWKRVAPGLSAGRVQSVAVRLLVERERERMAFRSAEYWDLKATLAAEEGAGGERNTFSERNTFEARLVRLGDRRIAEGRNFDPATGELTDADHLHLDAVRAGSLAAAAAAAKPWTVTSLETKPGSQNPSPPFITSTLQQEGNRKLRYTSKRTMRIAQQLYEGIDLDGERVGLITYMRTDSLTLAERAVTQARSVIADVYGKDYLPDSARRYRTQSKGAQEAHEAIRPTDLARRPQEVKRFLSDEQFKLYELIWKRTIACQMKPARFERTQLEVTVEVADGPLAFAASGKRIVFPGFLRAYVEGSDDPEGELGDRETLLPALERGQQVAAKAVEPEGHETKPPYRFTEASLVKKLEEAGIGRPSTYASIISTIQDRGYVFKRGNELVPTFTAFCVTQLLERQFRDLVDTDFTAHMEDDLDDVAAGKRSWDGLVADFFFGPGEQPGLQQRVEEGEVIYPAIPLGADPESGELLEVKVGKYGPYVRQGEDGPIASLPEDMPPADLTVERAVEMLKSKQEDPDPVTADPATGLPIFLRSGRFGFYLEREATPAEQAEKGNDKPHRVSLPKGVEPDSLSEEQAVALIQLPRTVGHDPESGEEIQAGLGRYGPYVRRDKDYRNLPAWEQLLTISLGEALEIFSQPKQRRGRGAAARTVLKDLGEQEGAEGPVKVLDGRYGPYVTDGKTNATLPKGVTPEALTAERALELLAEKRKAPKRGRRGGGKGKKKTAKK